MFHINIEKAFPYNDISTQLMITHACLKRQIPTKVNLEFKIFSAIRSSYKTRNFTSFSVTMCLKMGTDIYWHFILLHTNVKCFSATNVKNQKNYTSLLSVIKQQTSYAAISHCQDGVVISK